MINDMIYSGEQAVLHHWEGFPNNQIYYGAAAEE